MLIYRRTSMLESSAQTLVNTVNCVGVMGKGLAHAFKEREPAMFEAYKRICDQKLLEPGKLWLWRGSESWVLNFPTKKHWRHPSKLEWIEAGLAKFVAAYEGQGITEISFPQLGCGNGGLDWNDVRPIMERYLSDLPIPVYIHDYTVEIGLPEHLQKLSREIRRCRAHDRTFEGFLSELRCAVDLGRGEMVDLENESRFTVGMTVDDDLRIQTDRATLEFHADDLKSVWHNLQNGLVTKSEAGWSIASAARPMLSLLSVLPDVRPLQIQRSGRSSPELAVELAPEARRSTGAEQPKAQRELAWH